MAFSAIRNLRFEYLRGKHLLVALSGGADSVALLHILLKRAKVDSLKITCAHFHHGIRGQDADADAEFCRKLCARFDIELIVGFADIPEIARQKHIGLETAAREERYRFLRSAKEQCGADLIALAHHADDQAETVLMHLLRGTGPEGIAAMPMLSRDKFRPLIGIRKRELTDYLISEGIPWREDATNFVSDNPRNVLRLNVLPEIEKSNPSASIAIARYARTAAIENGFLSRLTDEFLARRLEIGAYGMRLCLNEPWEEAILRRAVRRICGSELDCAKLDEVILLAQKVKGKLQIFSDLYAEKTVFGLYFLRNSAKKPEKIAIQIPMDVCFGDFYRIKIDETDAEINRTDPNIEIVDCNILKGACIRLREDGDRIYPLGASGRKLLSDYLIDKKIDRPIRNVLPVIADGKNIFWVGGCGISENIRIKPCTKRRVRIQIYTNTEQKAEEKL